jgi:hypothetical protein
MFLNPGGVKNVKAKLQAQLKNVAKDTDLLRIYRGIISGGYALPGKEENRSQLGGKEYLNVETHHPNGLRK